MPSAALNLAEWLAENVFPEVGNAWCKSIEAKTGNESEKRFFRSIISVAYESATLRRQKAIVREFEVAEQLRSSTSRESFPIDQYDWVFDAMAEGSGPPKDARQGAELFKFAQYLDAELGFLPRIQDDLYPDWESGKWTEELLFAQTSGRFPDYEANPKYHDFLKNRRSSDEDAIKQFRQCQSSPRRRSSNVQDFLAAWIYRNWPVFDQYNFRIQDMLREAILKMDYLGLIDDVKHEKSRVDDIIENPDMQARFKKYIQRTNAPQREDRGKRVRRSRNHPDPALFSDLVLPMEFDTRSSVVDPDESEEAFRRRTEEFGRELAKSVDNEAARVIAEIEGHPVGQEEIRTHKEEKLSGDGYCEIFWKGSLILKVVPPGTEEEGSTWKVLRIRK